MLLLKSKAMELKAMHTQLALLVLMIASATAASTYHYQIALPGCNSTCGDVSIPFPFGVGKSTTTGKDCFLQKAFNVTCNNSVLYSGNVPILSINPQGQLNLKVFVSRVCYNSTNGTNVTKGRIQRLRGGPSFTVSSKENKFISVGCDTYGYLNSYRNGSTYSTGCLTRCYSSPDMENTQNNGNCSGIGCCQVDIPPRMRNISLQAFSFNNFNKSSSFNNCSYSFIAKQGSYNFSISHLENLPDQNLPMVIDWTVGNKTCKNSQHRPNFAILKGRTKSMVKLFSSSFLAAARSIEELFAYLINPEAMPSLPLRNSFKETYHFKQPFFSSAKNAKPNHKSPPCSIGLPLSHQRQREPSPPRPPPFTAELPNFATI